VNAEFEEIAVSEGSSREPASPERSSVAIIGGGVVGIATARGLRARGFKTTIFDTSLERVSALREEGFSAHEPSVLTETSPDFYFLSVPTPTTNGRIDLGPMRSAASTVGDALARRDDWSCVVVRSTVPPGTTDDLVGPILEERSGRTARDSFGLSMNPEFLRAASAAEDFNDPRVIVIGVRDNATEKSMRMLYDAWPDVPVMAMSNREAEAAKYTSNLFNAAKISFFNELHQTFASLGIDSTVAFDAVLNGAEGLWNAGYGTRGGAPFGGACLPKDSAAFIAFAKDNGIEMLILAAVIETNVRLGGELSIDAM
jgi:UDPglucose 6-dehydrogenase